MIVIRIIMSAMTRQSSSSPTEQSACKERLFNIPATAATSQVESGQGAGRPSIFVPGPRGRGPLAGVFFFGCDELPAVM